MNYSNHGKRKTQSDLIAEILAGGGTQSPMPGNAQRITNSVQSNYNYTPTPEQAQILQMLTGLFTPGQKGQTRERILGGLGA